MVDEVVCKNVEQRKSVNFGRQQNYQVDTRQGRNSGVVALAFHCVPYPSSLLAKAVWDAKVR